MQYFGGKTHGNSIYIYVVKMVIDKEQTKDKMNVKNIFFLWHKILDFS